MQIRACFGSLVQTSQTRLTLQRLRREDEPRWFEHIYIYIYIYIERERERQIIIYIYIYIYSGGQFRDLRGVGGPRHAALKGRAAAFVAWHSEKGMILVETRIELEFLNSSFSSSNCSIRVCRTCPLVETRQQAPCRAIRGKPSDSRQQYISVSSSLNPPL